MMPAIAMFAEKQLVHLSAVDVVIIAFYFALVLAIGFYLRGPVEHRRRLLHGGTRDDGMGRRPQLSLRQPGRARIDGLGRFGLSIRHSGDPLVLDRRHSGDAVPRAGDDAVLLHFQNPLGPGISEAAFRRTQPRPVRGFVRVHDRAHERRQHVCHGQGHANRAGLGHQLQHLGFVADGRHLCDAGRAALGDLQRSAAVLPHLGGRAADSDPRIV